MELPRLNGAKVANEWQPMSALIWVGPSSRCISLMAAKTGRSGQPVQKFGGRAGMSPTLATAPALCASIAFVRGRHRVAPSIPPGRVCARKAGQTLEQHFRGIFAGARQAALAEHAGLDVGAAQLDVDLVLDIVGADPPRPRAPRACRRRIPQLFGNQRIDDVEHVDGDARGAEEIGEIRAERARAARCW